MTRIARFTWFVLGFNVVVILLGSVVRATGSGAGCGRSWPTCQGQVVPDLEGSTAVEYLHRSASGIALLLVFALAIAVWRTTDRGHPARLGAGLAGAAIVGEALIGAMIVLAEWVADDVSVARAIAVPLHLVNTLFLLASLTLTAFWLSGGGRLEPGRDRRVTRVVVAGGVALILIAATGAITALADTLFPKEAGADLTAQSHFLTDLRIIHPILAVVVALLGWWLASRSPGGRDRLGTLLPVLVGVMLLSGVMNVFLKAPLWMQIVHLALADALWVTYVWTSARALQSSAMESRLSPSR